MKYASKRLTALAGAVGLALAGAAIADDDRYIIQFAPGAAGQGVAAVQAMGGEINVDLTERSVNAVSVTIPEQALRGLQNNPNIVNIEPDGRRYLMADQVPYGIEMVQAHLVSDQFAGNQNVCVIDSGYYIDHSDLQSNNVTATYDSRSGDPFIDPCGHGTHVTGTIAALANGSGVIGVLPSGNVGLHIVKVFGDDNWSGGSCGWSYSSSLVAAAYECADAGSNVINMSLGGGTSSSTEAQAFQDLFDQGILSVAAAGNSGNTSYSYPASYDSVISVAAIDANKQLASFSQRNDQVELAAPGVSVLSTTPFAGAQVSVGNDSYQATAMDRAASTTAEGDLVDGGLCTSAGNWSGRAVLCERGQISFSDKVSNVQAGGGVAAVIYNNETGNFAGTLDCSGPPHRACSSIPAVSISQEDGQYLVGNELGNSAFVSTVEVVPASGHDAWNGTSMASPHVAAVAALVWSYAPDASPAEIRAALAATAEDLGTAGRNNEFGYGLVQAQAALDYLGGGNGGGNDPDPEPEPNQPPTAAFSYSCDELDCTFDGSASTDSDGTIESYSWTFGDGNSASGAVVSHSYANDGSYTVTLTVTDNDGDSDSASQQVTVTAADDDDDGGDGESGGVSVASISVSTRSRGPWRNGEALVTVVDADGNTVSGATVTGTFSGDVSGTVTSEATGSNGVAVIESDRVRQNSISFEFCVDNISHPDFDYDATGNAETCVSN
jgi:serine protease